MKYSLAVDIRFNSPGDQSDGLREAEWVCRAIDADKEPRPKEIERTMRYIPESNTLSVVFRSDQLKMIRTATSALFEHVTLCREILERFHPQATK